MENKIHKRLVTTKTATVCIFFFVIFQATKEIDLNVDESELYSDTVVLR